MGQLRLDVQILRALEEVDPDFGGAIFEGCKHRTVICNEGLTRDMIENKLRPLLSAKGMVLNDGTIWDEEGTSCGLFAGSVDSEVYASIRKWVKDGDCSCSYCDDAICYLPEVINVSGGTFIFHLAIRCDSRMVSLIEHMRTFDNIEFTSIISEWHSLLNAYGAPCLHIAAHLDKLAIIMSLLLQKPETLNESFGSRGYTLMHVIADSGRQYPRNIIEFLMSEFRRPRVDMYARDSKGRTPLEIAFSRHMTNAETMYNLLSPQDQASLDLSHLLSKIAGNNGHKIQYKVEMIKLITTDDRKIDMANARSNPYNAAIDRVGGEWNEESTNTAITIWKALIANRVPMNYFDEHGTTPLAHAIEKAPSAFLELLDKKAEKETEQLGLNFLTVDKDGDTPHTLAQRSNDRSILDFIERNIGQQSRRPIPNHDPRSAAMAYLISKNFTQCLKYLDQLPESSWRQIMIARAHLGLGRCELALEAIPNLEQCGIVQHLKGAIFIKAQDWKKALDSIHNAYSKEARSFGREKLQRRYCCMVLSLVSVSKHLPFLPHELRMHICNIEAE